MARRHLSPALLLRQKLLTSLLFGALCLSCLEWTKNVQLQGSAWTTVPLRSSGLQRRQTLASFAGSVLGASSVTQPVFAAASILDDLKERECLVSYEVGGCAISVRVPKVWAKTPPTSSMRIAQYLLDPGVFDDAQLYIFYLPLGEGIDAQLARWEKEFPKEGRFEPATRTGEFDVAKGTGITLSVAGKWDGGGPSGKKDPDRPLEDKVGLRAAIVPAAPAGKGERQYAFFVKAVGPRGVIYRQNAAFDAFVQSIQSK